MQEIQEIETHEVKINFSPKKTADKRDIYVIKIEGDWNDGDEVSTTVSMDPERFKDIGSIAAVVLENTGRFCDTDLEELTSRLFPRLSEQVVEQVSDTVTDFQPSGIPDNAEFHTLYITEITYYDTNGNPWKVNVHEK
jgi:hypothetical protein